MSAKSRSRLHCQHKAPSLRCATGAGEHPCHSDGRKIRAIENSSHPQSLYDGVRADHTFSAKADYRDYHHKMTSYIARITGEATKLDPVADARTYPAIPAEDGTGPFKYVEVPCELRRVPIVEGPIKVGRWAEAEAVVGQEGVYLCHLGFHPNHLLGAVEVDPP